MSAILSNSTRKTVMVWNYQDDDCSFKKNKSLVLFIITFGTLSFHMVTIRRGRLARNSQIERLSEVAGTVCNGDVLSQMYEWACALKTRDHASSMVPMRAIRHCWGFDITPLSWYCQFMTNDRPPKAEGWLFWCDHSRERTEHIC